MQEQRRHARIRHHRLRVCQGVTGCGLAEFLDRKSGCADQVDPAAQGAMNMGARNGLVRARSFAGKVENIHSFTWPFIGSK